MPKYKFHASIGYQGAEREEIIEIPEEDLEGKTEEEINEMVQEEYDIWLVNNLDLSWWKIEEK